MHPDKSAVLVRSLVAGGVAEKDGRLEPGDRLIFVNETSLEFADLETTVNALKVCFLCFVYAVSYRSMNVKIQILL